jgi:peptidoglycan/LPS O-acetylase OafA/YrhL
MLPHLPVLDGLRAVAILLVLWCHIPHETPGYPEWVLRVHEVVGPGGLGVDIFFVLSGFLITRILLDERNRGVPVRRFLFRRVLRIFPIYYLLLLVMLFVRPSVELAWCAVYLSNLHYILAPQFPRSLGHTWSLCIEEHFYLLWPLVVAFLPVGRSRLLLACAVMPLALLTAYWMDLHYLAAGTSHETAMIAVQQASPVRFLSLGAGSLLAYVEPRIFAVPRRFVRLAVVLLVAAIGLHGYLVYLLPIWLGTRPLLPLHHAPLLWTVHSCCLSTSILLFCLTLGERRWSPLRLLHSAPMRGIGRISYGLYLYHLPIFEACLYGRSTWGNAALALLLAFATAIISYFALERPILRYAARVGHRPRDAVPTGAAA